MAAQISVAASVSDFLNDENINMWGPVHIMKAAGECNVKKIVFASSAVYGNPDYLPVDNRHNNKSRLPPYQADEVFRTGL
ncbi:NAD-dependent epimerase/dehydratase family protein [Bacillus halotolerans]|uniref:NAD-dependent epimerase/dehydratase family protein n=1 Tax=Bacillus halotolerans TaxID=260554 RepID=UPI002DBC3B66|nr:NAD-dependent epimerase/dehydratase family protein [Bacillus halotolerans]MEC1648751.1 NAD-dependent epimerase/dehydratase family protein [Bacillus halotolerans]